MCLIDPAEGSLPTFNNQYIIIKINLDIYFFGMGGSGAQQKFRELEREMMLEV